MSAKQKEGRRFFSKRNGEPAVSPRFWSLFATLMFLLLSGQGRSAGRDDPVRLEPGRKQLFLDDHIVGEIRNLDRVMQRPTKQGAVLLPDQPSDGRFVATVSAPMWIEQEGRYKMVYEGRPLRYAEEGFRWALATSRDGLVWEKPDLGAVEYRGSRANNLIAAPEKKRLWHVVHDPDDPDPARRYKGFLGHSGRRPVVSPDAVHWTILEVPTLPSGDAGTLTYDRERRQFLGLLKFGGKYGRSYNLSVSRDFVHWSEPRFLFSTDDQDQEHALEVIRRRIADPGLARPLFVDPDPSIGWSPPDVEFQNRGTWNAQSYNIGVFPYEGLYIGLPMIFYPTGARLPERRNTDGFHLIQLAMTRDLKHWERLGNREPFIGPSRLDQGLAGNYDRMQLMPTNRPVEKEEELWFYYSGFKWRVCPYDRYSDGSPRSSDSLNPQEHADYIDDAHSAIHVAVLRRDGFVSLDAGRREGTLTTRPLVMSGDRLWVNLDAPEGRIRVEVLDAGGRPVPGFSGGDSLSLSGDRTRFPIRWNGSDSMTRLNGQTVVLRIHLRKGSLYALWTE